MCHNRLQRTPEEIAQHVEECLRKVIDYREPTINAIKFNKNLLYAISMQTGQSRSEEEDETVDVESYGDETSNCAVNLASQNNNSTSNSNNNNNNTSNNNNNVSKMDSIQSSPRSHQYTTNEEHMITSRSNLWQTHTKHNHRIGTSPSMHSLPLNCVPTMFPVSNESGATPTSSDQITEYDHHSNDGSNANRCSTQLSMNNNNNNCDNDNDEEVIVDNANDDDINKKLMAPVKHDGKRSTDKNR